MAELLAWEGVWSKRMVETMLPYAIEAEADEARRTFGAVSGAIAGAFQKDGARPFLEGLERVKREVKARRPYQEKKRSPASDMLAIFGRMGLKIPEKGKR